MGEGSGLGPVQVGSLPGRIRRAPHPPVKATLQVRIEDYWAAGRLSISTLASDFRWQGRFVARRDRRAAEPPPPLEIGNRCVQSRRGGLPLPLDRPSLAKDFSGG